MSELKPLLRLPSTIAPARREEPDNAEVLHDLKKDLGAMKEELRTLELEQKLVHETQLAAAREKLRKKKKSDLARRLLEAQRLQMVMQKQQEEEEEKRSKVSAFKLKMTAMAEASMKQNSVFKEKLYRGLSRGEERTGRGGGGGRRTSVVSFDGSPELDRHVQASMSPRTTANDGMKKQRAAMSAHLQALRHVHSASEGPAVTGTEASTNKPPVVLLSARSSTSALMSPLDAPLPGMPPEADSTSYATNELRSAHHELQQLQGEDESPAPDAILKVLDRMNEDASASVRDDAAVVDTEAERRAFEARVEAKYEALEKTEVDREKREALLNVGTVLRDDQIVRGKTVKENAVLNEKAGHGDPTVKVIASAFAATLTSPLRSDPMKKQSSDSVTFTFDRSRPGREKEISFADSNASCESTIVEGDNLTSVTLAQLQYDVEKQATDDRQALIHAQLQQKFVTGLQKQKETIAALKKRIVELEENEKNREQAATSEPTADAPESAPASARDAQEVQNATAEPENNSEQPSVAQSQTERDTEEVAAIPQRSVEDQNAAARHIQRLYRGHRGRTDAKNQKSADEDELLSEAAELVAANKEAIRELHALGGSTHPEEVERGEDSPERTAADPETLEDLQEELQRQNELIEALTEEIAVKQVKAVAATKIQSAFRGKRQKEEFGGRVHRRREDIQNVRRDDAALVIQQNYRRHRACMGHVSVRKQLMRRYGATATQLESASQLRTVAAITMQCFVRARMGRQRASRLRRFRQSGDDIRAREAATLIQAQVRGAQSKMNLDSRKQARKEEWEKMLSDSEREFSADPEWQ